MIEPLSGTSLVDDRRFWTRRAAEHRSWELDRQFAHRVVMPSGRVNYVPTVWVAVRRTKDVDRAQV